MSSDARPLIVIPARLASTRLPHKPLAMIGDAPMIVQVMRRAIESGVGDVVVACDGEEIAGAVRAAGGVAIVTDPDLPSGSDRVWAAVQELGAGACDIIINLQGDLPTLDPALLGTLLTPFAEASLDIVTMAAPISRAEEKASLSVVKPIFGNAHEGWREAIDFVRGPAPEPMYHHIGVYAYQRAALEKFVSLPPSQRELEHKLEQLRALDAGMRMGCVLVNTVPLGVDTPEDLEAARNFVRGAW